MKLYLLLAISILLFSCKAPENNLSPQKNTFKEEMRLLVENLSKNAKTKKTTFLIIPQNGLELLLNNHKTENSSAYISAIDGLAVENLIYEYKGVDSLNNQAENDYKAKYLAAISSINTPTLALDYCIEEAKIKYSFSKNTTSPLLIS